MNKEELQDWLADLKAQLKNSLNIKRKSVSTGLEADAADGAGLSSLRKSSSNAFSNVNSLVQSQPIETIIEILSERSHEHEMMSSLCSQLLQLYRSGGEYRRMVFQCIPALCYAYLQACAEGRQKECLELETLLLGIYNLDIVGKNGLPDVKHIRLPNLSCTSIYHDPVNFTLGLAESSFSKRGGTREPYIIEIGPYIAAETINAQNRFIILTRLLRSYNAHLHEMTVASRSSLCMLASNICRSGFNFPDTNLVHRVIGNYRRPSTSGSANTTAAASSTSPNPSNQTLSSPPPITVDYLDDLSSSPRISLHPAFLIELINGVYFCMFNEHAIEGIQAVDDINYRARYEMYADVLLITTAIEESLLENPSGQPCDGPMGLVVSGRGQAHSFYKHSHAAHNHHALVTNASLRIKKLPEDIPIKQERDELKESMEKAASRSPKERSGPIKASKKHHRPHGKQFGRADATEHLLLVGPQMSVPSDLKSSKSEVFLQDLTSTSLPSESHVHTVSTTVENGSSTAASSSSNLLLNIANQSQSNSSNAQLQSIDCNSGGMTLASSHASMDFIDDKETAAEVVVELNGCYEIDDESESMPCLVNDNYHHNTATTATTTCGTSKSRKNVTTKETVC